MFESHRLYASLTKFILRCDFKEFSEFPKQMTTRWSDYITNLFESDFFETIHVILRLLSF